MFKMKTNVAAIAAVLSGLPFIAHAGFNTAANTDGTSSEDAYLLPTAAGWNVKALLTAGDSAANGYVMDGLPDGMGAYDNGNGTFTVLMNHEFGSASGTIQDHGAKGAYVSQFVIDKATLKVLSGSDLIKNVYGWNSTTQASNTTTSAAVAFNRFCSADLPFASALYNANTGMGTQAKLFMNGEEGGNNGYAVATVATGADAGNAYILGKFNLATNGSGGSAVGAWENVLLNPFAQDKTIAIGNNDGGTGSMNNTLGVYVGTKTNVGSEVDKAGLTNGVLKFISIDGVTQEIANGTTRATGITDGASFSLSNTGTVFSRPEDGAWSADGSKFFFVTTDQIDKTELTGQTQIGRSRLWELDFNDITNPDLGGNVHILLDGTEGQNMLDNMTVSADGKSLILQEDTGNAPHNAKVWSFDLSSKTLTQILEHDSAKFGDVVGGASVAGAYTQDEESSGVIDVSEILGYKAYLMVTQNHAVPTNSALVEGGQLQLVTAPVPVPGAAWLFGTALAGFLGLRRRKA